MPYVVTQAGFLEAGPEAPNVGRLERTMWVVQFDDPLPALDRVTYKSAITDPLQVYVEALRPEVQSGQMDFVVNYIVSWRNATRDTFEISPTLIRLYLDGQIGIRELSRTMVITVTASTVLLATPWQLRRRLRLGTKAQQGPGGTLCA